MLLFGVCIPLTFTINLLNQVTNLASVLLAERGQLKESTRLHSALVYQARFLRVLASY